MSKKSTSKKTKTAAGKSKIEPIIAQDLISAAMAISNASAARWNLSQKQLMPSLAPEKFWSKETIKTMRKRYGNNFPKADRILRALAIINLRIETMKFLLEGLNGRLGRTLNQEKELMQRVRALQSRGKSA